MGRESNKEVKTMTEQNILYLMVGPYWVDTPLMKLIDKMRDDLFIANSDKFDWDEKEALGQAKNWLTEVGQDGWVSVFEAPANMRDQIIEIAEGAGWKVIEFELVQVDE